MKVNQSNAKALKEENIFNLYSNFKLEKVTVQFDAKFLKYGANKKEILTSIILMLYN